LMFEDSNDSNKTKYLSFGEAETPTIGVGSDDSMKTQWSSSEKVFTDEKKFLASLVGKRTRILSSEKILEETKELIQGVESRYYIDQWLQKNPRHKDELEFHYFNQRRRSLQTAQGRIQNICERLKRLLAKTPSAAKEPGLTEDHYNGPSSTHTGQ
jgi:hypothetical protein